MCPRICDSDGDDILDWNADNYRSNIGGCVPRTQGQRIFPSIGVDSVLYRSCSNHLDERPLDNFFLW